MVRNKHYKDGMAYMVPTIFSDKKKAEDYLKRCGFPQPRMAVGKLYYLLNLLREAGHLSLRRYHKNRVWKSLHIAVVRKLFGDVKYFYLLAQHLSKDGFLEINHQYTIGKKTKQYRLTPLIQTAEWKIVWLSVHHCSLTKKLCQRFYDDWQPVDHKLYGLLARFKLDKIDFFEKTTAENFQTYPCPMLDALAKNAKNKNEIIARYAFYKDCYNSIHAGVWRYKVDCYGRRHNNLTNLPKLLRQHLYIVKKGVKRRLSSIDISNSQVLLLLTILDPGLADYPLFKEVVEEGVFYEALAHMCGSPYTSEQRGQLKKNYFHFIYGDNSKSYLRSSDVFCAMMDYFPTICTYIDTLKACKGYTYPARQMQREEASVLIDFVCANAIKKRLVFAQIYDSILCLPEDLETFKTLLQRAFAEKAISVDVKIE